MLINQFLEMSISSTLLNFLSTFDEFDLFACIRVGFLPEETYFFQDNGRNMVSSVFSHFLPEEMEEWDL